METLKYNFLLNLFLLVSIVSLFVYIKYYFSTLSTNIKNRLQTFDIVLSVMVGLMVFTVIGNRNISLPSRYVFFATALLIHIGTALILLHNLRKKANIFPRSYMIFHKGKFYKGTISQNKLSESDIMQALKLKGVSDLSEVDTIILETTGELSVIYKDKLKSAA
jgi:uncharacterized membrane protein YcaP (DUF421 family)